MALFQLPVKQKGDKEETNIFMHGDKRGMDRIQVVWSVGYKAQEECIEIWKRAP